MSRWDGLNRRMFPRVNYPCLVVIHNRQDQENLSILTHTENIGIGGVCVTLRQHLKVFDSVDLELDLLDMAEHIKCSGKIVWSVRRKIEASSNPLFYDVGIEFEAIPKNDQARIEHIVQRLDKEYKTSFPL